MTSLGLGAPLIKRMLAYAKDQYISEIYGDAQRKNARVLRLCERPGFAKAPDLAAPSIVRTFLALK